MQILQGERKGRLLYFLSTFAEKRLVTGLQSGKVNAAGEPAVFHCTCCLPGLWLIDKR
ncbi:MAG: hypothetical protein IPH20_20830 [Bacteroidales bacterium]|nr:hypothetical protein [Bacteroidales bacterium]